MAPDRPATLVTGSTYLFFHRPTAARLMWLFVRPVHLRVERQLLAGAARALTDNRLDVPARDVSSGVIDRRWTFVPSLSSTILASKPVETMSTNGNLRR